MTRNDFLVKLGIAVTEDVGQTKQTVDGILERARSILNQKLNLNIQVGDYDAVLKNFDKLQTRVNVMTRNLSGIPEKLSFNFEDQNKGITTLQMNIGDVKKEVISLQEALNRGLIPDTSVETLREIRDSGAAIGASGNILSNRANLTRGGAPAFQNIIATTGIDSTTSTKYNEKYLVNDLIEAYNNLLTVKKKITSTEEGSPINTNLKNQLDYWEKAITQIKAQMDEMGGADSALGGRVSQITKRSEIKAGEIEDTAKTKEAAVLIRDLKGAYDDLLKAEKELGQQEEGTAYYEDVKLRAGDAQTKIDDLKNSIQALSTTDSTLNKKVVDIESGYQKSSKEQVDLQDQKDLNKILEEQLRKYEELGKAKAKLATYESADGSDALIQTQKEKIRSIEQEISTLGLVDEKTKTLTTSNKTYQLTQQQVEQSTKAAQKAQQAYDNALEEARNNINRTGISFGSLANKIKETAENVFRYKLAFSAFNQIDRVVGQSIQKIRELDTATTEIQMVTGQTNEEVHDLMNTYSEMGKRLGATTLEVAAGSVEWLRQGKTIAETEKLLTASTMLSKVGAMDAADATEKLTAAVNGFRLSANEAMGVVDKLAAADLAYATSSKEIATALQYVSNSAQDAGVSLDKLIGLITITSQTTRLGAEQIGTAFKTVFARMTNVKLGVFTDPETDDAINDTEKVLNSLGISIRKSADEWRDMEDVLDEVGKKWNQFTQVEKSAIAVTLAGVRQKDKLLAVFNNYDKVLEATAVSQDAAGTSAEKYVHVLDSIDAKINQLVATWEQLVNNTNKSDAFKGVVDSVTILTKVLDVLLNDLGLLNLLFVGGLAYSGFAMVNLISKLVIGYKTLSIAVAAYGTSQTVATAADNAAKVTALANILVQKGYEAELARTTAQLVVNSHAQNTNVASMKKAQVTIIGLIQKFITLSTVSKVAFGTAGIGIIALVAGIKWYANRVDVAREKTEEFATALQTAESELQAVETELDGVNTKIKELEAQDSLTIIEQEELDKLKAAREDLEEIRKYREEEAQKAQKDYAKAKLNEVAQAQSPFTGTNFTPPTKQKTGAQFQSELMYRSGLGGELDNRIAISEEWAESDDIYKRIYALEELQRAYEETDDVSKKQDIKSSMDDARKSLEAYAVDFKELERAVDDSGGLQVFSSQDQGAYKFTEQATEEVEKVLGNFADGITEEINKALISADFAIDQKKLDDIRRQFSAGLIDADEFNKQTNAAVETVAENLKNTMGEKLADVDMSNLIATIKDSLNVGFMEDIGDTFEEQFASSFEKLGVQVEKSDDQLDEFANDLEQLTNDVKSGTIQTLTDLNDALDKAFSKMEDPDFSGIRTRLQDQVNLMEESISHATALGDAMTDLADGEALTGKNLNEFLDSMKEIPEVTNSATGEVVNIYDTLMKYLDDTGDATFKNGELVRENLDVYVKAAKDEIDITRKKITQTNEMEVQFYNNRIKRIELLMTAFANAIRQIPVIGAGIATAIENKMVSLVEGYKKKIEESNTAFKKQNDELKDTEIRLNNIYTASLDAYNTARIEAATKAQKEYNDALKAARDALEDLIDDTISMLKWEYEEEKNSIEKRKKEQEDYYDSQKENIEDAIDEYEKEIDAQLKLLEAQKDAADYQKGLEEKTSDVAKLQNQLDILAGDDSIEAQAKRAEIIEELNKAQSELDEYQSDHAYDMQKEALESLKDQYDEYQQGRLDDIEKEKKTTIDALEEEIDAIEEKVNNERELYLEAIGLIEGRTTKFYNRLVEWNKIAGTHIDADIIQKWNLAYQALEKYNQYGKFDLQATLEMIASQIYATTKATEALASAGRKTADAFWDAYEAAQAMSDKLVASGSLSNPDTDQGDYIGGLESIGAGSGKSVSDLKKEIDEYLKKSDKLKSQIVDLADELDQTWDEKSRSKIESKIKSLKDQIQKMANEITPIYNAYYAKGGSVITRSHSGETSVTKKTTPYDELLGVGSDETLRILKVGETILPTSINANADTEKLTNSLRGSNYQPGETTPSISIGNIVVQGNATDETIEKLNEFRKKLLEDVYKSLQKHSKITGFNNIRFSY